MDTKAKWSKASKENWVTVKILRTSLPILVKIVRSIKWTRGEVMEIALKEFAEKRGIKI